MTFFMMLLGSIFPVLRHEHVIQCTLYIRRRRHQSC